MSVEQRSLYGSGESLCVLDDDDDDDNMSVNAGSGLSDLLRDIVGILFDVNIDDGDDDEMSGSEVNGANISHILKKKKWIL